VNKGDKDEEVEMLEAEQNEEEASPTPENRASGPILKSEEEPKPKTKGLFLTSFIFYFTYSVEKLFGVIAFVFKFFTKCLNLLTNYFNWHSREHRYVAFVLDREKVRLKTVMEEVSSRI
jgi:hypothetical protein